MIIPTWDRTLPTAIACVDETLRAFDGVPTYALTDNGKTVTTTHVCPIAVRHPEIFAASRHYGMVIHTCTPADPQSKGGSEATVRIAKADLAAACRDAMERFNARKHRETRGAPNDAIQDERMRLRPVPEERHTLAGRRCETLSAGATPG